MNEKFNQLLEEIGEELEEDESTTLERIEETIENISNIIRFIDGKIITNLSYVTNSRGNLQIVSEYYDDPGILIYEQKNQYSPEEQETKIGLEFHETDNIPKDQMNRYFGIEIYLTREGELVKFNRDEIVVPGKPEKHRIRLFDEREIEVEEILEMYPDFEEKFYGCFKKVILNTIEKNPKKRGILDKIIEYINRIEERDE